jgi:phosphotriesterase-related protein
MTTAGPVDAAALGVTLMHEHIFVNMLQEARPAALLNDYPLMREEIGAFTEAGGKTVVDLSVAEMTHGAAPDPTGIFGGPSSTGYAEQGTRSIHNVLNLQKLAQDTGLNIILGTGHYRDPFIDTAWFDRVGVAGIAELMVNDLTSGFVGTDVRAGIIGEIGADKWFVSSAEERSFRASARAHLATGVTISTHAAKWPVGIAQLDILTQEGVDPRRVVIGHCDTVNIPEYHLAIARRGAFVQFDNIRCSNEYDLRTRVGHVIALAKQGFLDQILLSQDVCKTYHLNINGGGGYNFVLVNFAAALIDAGLDKEEVAHIVVDNPRRALTGS